MATDPFDEYRKARDFVKNYSPAWDEGLAMGSVYYSATKSYGEIVDAGLEWAKRQMLGNTPAWKLAVNSYNAGVAGKSIADLIIDPRLADYFTRYQDYFRSGEMIPGSRPTSESMRALFISADQQWARDSESSPLSNFMEFAIPAVIGAMAGGAFGGEGIFSALGSSVAAGGGAVVSSAAEIAAASGIPMEAAAAYSAAGYSAAEIAGYAVADALAASASVVSNASTAQTFSQALTASRADTAAFLYGAPVTSQTLLAGVSPIAADTLTFMEALQASNAAIMAAPLTDAAIWGVGQAAADGGFLSYLKGANMTTIWEDIGGTVKDIGGTVASVYGTVAGTQLQLAQTDLAKAQALAAAQPQQPAFYQTASGGVNWTTIMLAAVALFGAALVFKKTLR